MRSANDDSFFLDLEAQVYAVADGLGGLPEGALASSLAVTELEHFVDKLPKGQWLDYGRLFSSANGIVQDRGAQINRDLGIGTTLSVAQIIGETMYIGHAGDSGVFVFTSDTWVQLTRDHTMAQEMLERLAPDEHAYIPEYFSHTLTRCVGQNAPLEVDTYEYKLCGKERILLYTDGVTKTMEMRELHQMVYRYDTPKDLVAAIIDLANKRGGPDNITAIAIFND